MLNTNWLLYGCALMTLLAYVVYLTEGSFVGARPYAAGAITLMCIALSIK